MMSEQEATQLIKNVIRLDAIFDRLEQEYRATRVPFKTIEEFLAADWGHAREDEHQSPPENSMVIPQNV